MDTESTVIIPVGRGASIHGTEVSHEDVMEWDRRSLDLSDTCCVSRAASPAPSYLSMESDGMDCSHPGSEPDAIATRVELERSDSDASSLYSLESDEDVNADMKPLLKVRKKPKNKKFPSGKPELVLDPNYKRHPALTFKFTFMFLQQVLKKLTEPQLKFFKKYLWEHYPEFFRDPLDVLDILDLSDKMLECCDIEISLSITQHVIQLMGLKKLVSYICGHLKRNEVRYHLRQQLKEQYRTFHDGCPQEGAEVDFESAFVENHVTQGMYVPVNGEHELRGLVPELEIEKSFDYPPMKNKDILDPKTTTQRYVSCMLMRGIAGSGKSVAVQRYILDWANETAHEEIYFLFPLLGSEYLPILDKETTFRDLLNSKFPSLEVLDELDIDDCQLMFILDDVEELLPRLDFLYSHGYSRYDTVKKVRMLLINLIKGHLLYHSYVWLASRPFACANLPRERVGLVLDVRGFGEESRMEFFRRRFCKDPALAERMVAYLCSNRTLFIMCHLPLFCWVAAQVLEELFRKYPPGAEPPSTLTELYARLVRVQFSVRQRNREKTPPVKQGPCVEGKPCKKDSICLEGQPCKEGWPFEDEKPLLVKIGKVAFGMLEKEVFQKCSSSWKDEEAHPVEALSRCGLCTEYLRQRYIMYNEKLCCFIHPTVQEFMAALYVFLTFRNQGKNVLDNSKWPRLTGPSLLDVYKSAVDRTLHHKGDIACNYDFFLRFLVGMGAESNQSILGSLMDPSGFKSCAPDDIAKVVRKKMKDHPDRRPNLEKCLEELYPMKCQETNSLKHT